MAFGMALPMPSNLSPCFHLEALDRKLCGKNYKLRHFFLVSHVQLRNFCQGLPRALDVGCGSGREAILLATRGWEAGCEILQPWFLGADIPNIQETSPGCLEETLPGKPVPFVNSLGEVVALDRDARGLERLATLAGRQVRDLEETLKPPKCGKHEECCCWSLLGWIFQSFQVWMHPRDGTSTLYC